MNYLFAQTEKTVYIYAETFETQTMSNVENLKRIRSTAKARLTNYGNNFRKYITDNNSLETVDALYSDFVCAWKNLEAYVCICGDNESSVNGLKFKEGLMTSVSCIWNIRKLVKFKHNF